MKTELFRILLALTIASTLSILVTLTVRRVVRHVFGAAAGYSTWFLVPASMLTVLLPNPPNPGSAIGILYPVSALSHALDRSLGSSLHTASSVDWIMWALATWVVGAALFVLYLAGLQRAFVNGLGALSGSRCVLRAERCSGCPAVLGVFRPKVILPVDFESRYTRLERLLVFSHERTHLRRGDAVWNALTALVRCLLWFNPLVHVASTCLRADQEFSCDAAVVEDHPGSRRTYATAMLKTQLADTALPVGCHWHSLHHLKERLQMLKKTTPSRQRRACGHLLVAVTSFAVGFTAWAAEPDATRSIAPSATASSNEIRGSRLTMMLEPHPNVETYADHANFDQDNHVVTLEGHVRVIVHRTPSDQATAAHLRSVVIEGDRVVITPQAAGAAQVEIENGSIRDL